MKKNKAMRLAAVLLVVTLLSTCVVSGTFAKYTTSAGATDSAQVAEFGIIVTASGEDCFAEDYDANASSYTVSAAGDYDLVAPGTKNANAASFSIKGTSEVAVKVEVSLGTDVKDVFLKAGTYYDMTKGIDDSNTAASRETYVLGSDYYPVKFKLVHEFGANCWPIVSASDTSNNIKVYEYTNSAKTAKSEVTTAKTSGTYENGGYVEITDMKLSDLSTILGGLSMDSLAPGYTFDDSFTLSWAWAFDGDDKADTILGDLAAGETVSSAALVADTDYCLDEAFNFSITVTQVD